MNVPWGDLGLVLVVGLVAGAGLVAVFALGVATLAGPAGQDGTATAQSSTTKIIGYACLVIVAVAALYGIYLAIPGLRKIF
jgi:hypothetical protein